MNRAALRLFTIGYEGRTLGRFMTLLKEQHVQRLVDVRLTPQSRQRGFALMALFEGARKAGLTYEHVGGLGNPPDIRALWHSGEIDKGRARYRRFLGNGKSTYVDLLIGLVQIETTAIMCRERDHTECHRSVIADVVKERVQFPVEIVHL